jgi:hypothetical protein
VRGTSTLRLEFLLCALCFTIAGAACRNTVFLDGDWGIPPQEGEGIALSREVVLVADNQIQHLYGDPVWLRSGFTNRFVSVAIRAVQLNFFGPHMLRWIVENYGDKRLVIHLGDALNVACSAEWKSFLIAMQGAQRGWLLAPGNHDAFYFGNGDFSRGEWERACNTDDGSGRSFLKDRFVEAYLLALASQATQGIPGFAFAVTDSVPEEGL